MIKTDRDMKKYNTDPKLVESIISSGKKEGLSKTHILLFSSMVYSSPKKWYKVRGAYTKGNIGVRSKNNNYKSQLQIWKKEHVFLFFEEFGFTKSEISEAWKEFINQVK